jgi:hypothetical protein
LGKIDYAEARASYLGATIVRKPLFVRKDYILLSDQITAANPHSYQWQLNALGLAGGDSTHGTFVLDSVAGMATWTKNDVRLQAVVTAQDGLSSLQGITKVHELRYDSIETHTMLQATHVGAANTSFLAALIPFEADSPDVRLLCGPTCDAIEVRRGGYVDVAFVGNGLAASASGLSHDLIGDAATSFYSESQAGDFSQWMMQSGTVLRYGLDTLGMATVRSNWALAVVDSVSDEGFAGAPGTLYVWHLGFVPQSVLGWNVVQSWFYDANLDRLEIVFSGAGRFTIHKDFILGQLVHGGENALQIWPNPSTDLAHGRLANVVTDGIWVLHDLNGRAVLRGAITNGTFELQLARLAAGMYILEAYDAAGALLGVQELMHQQEKR